MDSFFRKLTDWTVRIVSSRQFFWTLIVLLVFQGVWIAFSFRFPMVYDESFHFGITDYLSHQWLPWVNHQPSSLDIYGAIERQPNILYHYLLSFPLRFVRIFTDNLALNIISLRLINIALFTAGLLVFMKVFREMGVRSIFRNISLFFLIFLPLTPFIAAHINYDNAVFLLTAVVTLLGVRLYTSNKVVWHQYTLLLIVGLVGGLIKLSFLPIFLSILIFITVRWIVRYKRNLIKKFYESFNASKLLIKVVVIASLVIVVGLFVERYGINIIQHQALSPSCEAQLTEERCNKDPIGSRTVEARNAADSIIPIQNPEFTIAWLTGMLQTILWTGSSLQDGHNTFGSPMPVIYGVVFYGSVAVLFIFAYAYREVKKMPAFYMLLGASLVYIGFLYYTNVSYYNTMHQLGGIQGRYLLPLLPFIVLAMVMAVNHLLKKRREIKTASLILISILYLNGAGLTTHIVRSDASWNWANQKVIDVNNSARETISPFLKVWWYKR